MSLNRKKSLSLSFTTWSNRTLVELIEAGFDQLPMYWAIPFAASSIPLGFAQERHSAPAAEAAGAHLLAAGSYTWHAKVRHEVDRSRLWRS